MAIFKKEAGVNTPVEYTLGKQNVIPLTYAQYMALTEAERNNGTIYHITDRSAVTPTAENSSYDNTQSGLTATNVQGAVDELSSDLSELVIKRLTTAVSYSITAGGYDTSINSAVPSVTGYTPVGVIGYSTGGMYIFAMNVQLSGSGVVATLFNADTVNPRSGSFQATVLYVKTNSVGQ